MQYNRVTEKVVRTVPSGIKVVLFRVWLKVTWDNLRWWKDYNHRRDMTWYALLTWTLFYYFEVNNFWCRWSTRQRGIRCICDVIISNFLFCYYWHSFSSTYCEFTPPPPPPTVTIDGPTQSYLLWHKETSFYDKPVCQTKVIPPLVIHRSRDLPGFPVHRCHRSLRSSDLVVQKMSLWPLVRNGEPCRDTLGGWNTMQH